MIAVTQIQSDHTGPPMPNRVYLLIALAFMIGGPLAVYFISGALPPPRHEVSEAETAPVAAAPTAKVAPEPMPEPPPPPSSPDELPLSVEPAFDPVPSLDTDAFATQVSSDAPPPPLTAASDAPKDGETPPNR
jgi:hypothetical protein